VREITRLREECGWTKQEVGARAGLSPALVGKLENGREVPRPDSVVLKRLAAALKWTGDPAGLLEECDPR